MVLSGINKKLKYTCVRSRLEFVERKQYQFCVFLHNYTSVDIRLYSKMSWYLISPSRVKPVQWFINLCGFYKLLRSFKVQLTTPRIWNLRNNQLRELEVNCTLCYLWSNVWALFKQSCLGTITYSIHLIYAIFKMRNALHSNNSFSTIHFWLNLREAPLTQYLGNRV